MDRSRRQLIKGLAGVGVLSMTSLDRMFQNWSNQPNRISYLANRGSTFAGKLVPRKIEGSIPAELEGTLFRNGPGSKEIFGRTLNHFFDGDGQVTAFRLQSGQVSIQSAFVETKERQQEAAAQKMLFQEFGTKAPQRALGYKNPPNIHIYPFADKLLALSESSHPTEVDPKSLNTIGDFDFNGQLSGSVTFTAHPKKDPKTGEIYAFGISRALFPELKIFRIEEPSLKLKEIGAVRLGGFYPIHDMMMTENYLVFTVSPMKINLLGAATMSQTISELLEYDANQPLRILIVRKDGNEAPRWINSSPAGLIFHHVNAFEDAASESIFFDSFLIEDASAYKVFQAWGQEQMPAGPKSWITRFQIDLRSKKIISRENLTEALTTDFPCVDPRLLGQPMDSFWSLESDTGVTDPLAFNQIIRWDGKSVSPVARIKAEPGQIFSEPVFAPENWLLVLGFDQNRDETFFDIRNSQSLAVQARIWLGMQLPLGFHGSFVLGNNHN
jgi:all-trans-8'-apo-beta-carotenal 15,15'-oxygenase